MIFPIKGGMGIYLPFFTCSFSTQLCREYCYQKKLLYPTEKQRMETYLNFINKSPKVVANTILKELGDNQILHWFMSGDCWTEAEDFIYEIIYLLNNKGIHQLGFTRNITLWFLLPDIFILSIDQEKVLDDIIENYELRNMFDKNQYKNLRVALKVDKGIKVAKIIIGRKETKREWVNFCGGRTLNKYYEYNKSITKIKECFLKEDCSQCQQKSIGCFDRKSFKMEKRYNDDEMLELSSDTKILQYIISLKEEK